MHSQSLTAKRFFINVCLLTIAAVILSAPARVVAQQADYAAERQRALQLYDENKFADAIPILEKLVKIKSDDPDLWERLGWATLVVAGSIKDSTERKQARDRARAALLRAKALGDDSNLLRGGLESLAGPDPADLSFSRKKEADDAMREGEEAHARGDLDKALSRYKRALELEPQLYEAALYAGDMEFKKAYNSTDAQYRGDHFDASGVWFAKAIAMDANRETAYRYWGDALDAQGKTDLARDKFVDAIVAEPYGRRAYVGLTQWGQRHQVTLGHPRIQPEWLMYDLTRMAWSKGEFFKNYPDERVYRHSLKEEAAALRMVAEAAAKDLKSGKVKTLEVSLDNLVRMNDNGLLEPYILFAHPDQGIALDYAAYRKANRDKLRRYWLEVAIGIK